MKLIKRVGSTTEKTDEKDGLLFRWRNERTGETEPYSGPKPRGLDWTLESFESIKQAG